MSHKSVDITDEKAVQKTLRDVAVARYAERAAQLKEKQAQVKHEQGKFAVRQQMKVRAACVSYFLTSSAVKFCT